MFSVYYWKLYLDSSQLGIYVKFGFSVWFPQQMSGIVFRIMELDRKILGRAYIARIKARDVHGGVDQLYGIAYKSPKEEMDHVLFNSVCSVHNNKFFYSKTVNKKTETFTMRECLDMMVNFPKLGTSGLSMLDYPMTLTGFGKLAYEQQILVSKSGYDLLEADEPSVERSDQRTVPVPPPTVVMSKVRKSIEKKRMFSSMMDTVRMQAQQFKDVIVDPSSVPQGDALLISSDGSVMAESVLASDDIPFGGEEEIIAPAGDGFDNLTVDALRDRCIVAEAGMESLQAVIEEKDAQIDELKKKLEAATTSSEKFMRAADLADVQRREYRADNASEVVEGLKPEFNLLKGVSNKVTALTSTVDKGSQEQVLVMTEILQTLDDLPRKLQNFADGVHKHLCTNIVTMVDEVAKVLAPENVEDSRGFSIRKFTDYADDDTDVEVIEDDDEDSALGQSKPSSIPIGVIVAVQGKQLGKKSVRFVPVDVDQQVVETHHEGKYLLQQGGKRNNQGILPTPDVTRSNKNMRPNDLWIQPPKSFKRGADFGDRDAQRQSRRF